MCIEYETLEKARVNKEQAYADLKSLDFNTPEWDAQWELYKHLSSTYRTYLCAYFNL